MMAKLQELIKISKCYASAPAFQPEARLPELRSQGSCMAKIRAQKHKELK